MQDQKQVQPNQPSPIQQEQPQLKDKFDQDLHEGKQILDQLHNDYNQINAERVNPNPTQPQNRGQPFASQPLQKGDSQRMDNFPQQQQKDESISFSKNMNKKPSKLFQGCNCLKSKCSKNYCQCFTQGRRCNELCKCMDCTNQNQNQYRLRANIEVEGAERACYCKKSYCLKKYCECYNNGVKCRSTCKCEQCKNTEDSLENERGMRQQQQQQIKGQPQKQRSQQQVQEINNKIDEITRITPPQYQQLMFSFLQYWLS